MASYDNGVLQIRPDGTLPQEMARGSRAPRYHLYALAPLVLLAEFGKLIISICMLVLTVRSIGW
jgi:poly(beta-D-mannuronate) lyase